MIEHEGDVLTSASTTTANLVYILQAASFFVGLTCIAAIIINYLKLDSVRGTWVESHFRWQIRTFWWSLLWGIIGGILVWVLIGYVILGLNFLWVIYRIAKGWLKLNSQQPMYAD